MIDPNVEPAVRDRAILIVRLATFGGVASAVGLSWVFADLAEAFFSGKPPSPAQAAAPVIPLKAAPVQKPPTVIQKIVHHPYQAGSGAPAPAGSGPRPPASGPGPAPPPPPPPPCRSTPSKPC